MPLAPLHNRADAAVRQLRHNFEHCPSMSVASKRSVAWQAGSIDDVQALEARRGWGGALRPGRGADSGDSQFLPCRSLVTSMAYPPSCIQLDHRRCRSALLPLMSHSLQFSRLGHRYDPFAGTRPWAERPRNNWLLSFLNMLSLI